MALTLEYSVTGLKVRDEVNSEGVTLPNAVVQTYWKVVGTDENGNSDEWSGATPFSAANVPSSNFRSFEELQEEDVLAWITSVVENDPSYKAHIVEQLEKKIGTNVSKEANMPWAPDVTPTPVPTVEEVPEVSPADPLEE
jgi:hypothetical protein